MDFTLNSLTSRGFLKSCSSGDMCKSPFLKEKKKVNNK